MKQITLKCTDTLAEEIKKLDIRDLEIIDLPDPAPYELLGKLKRAYSGGSTYLQQVHGEKLFIAEQLGNDILNTILLQHLLHEHNIFCEMEQWMRNHQKMFHFLRGEPDQNPSQRERDVILAKLDRGPNNVKKN